MTMKKASPKAQAKKFMAGGKAKEMSMYKKGGTSKKKM